MGRASRGEFKAADCFFESSSSERCFVGNGFSEGAGEIRAGEIEEGREEVDRRTIETSTSDVVR